MALVTKEYNCPNCGDIEIFQTHTEISKKCPTCKAKIERVISRPLVAKDGGPRTIGSQIDLNNKRNPLSREKAFGVGAEKKLEAQSRMKKIQRMTPEQKKKFIETGNL